MMGEMNKQSLYCKSAKQTIGCRMGASVTSLLNIDADMTNMASKSLQADCPDFAVGG